MASGTMTQKGRVFAAFSSRPGEWLSLGQITIISGHGPSSVAAVSARIRELRGEGHRIVCCRRSGGYFYRYEATVAAEDR